MNLMEITKEYEPKQNEQTEQRKNLPDTTDRWKQLAQDQAKTLEAVITERNELQVKYQKMNEFILEFQERTHNLKMEKQKLFFKNHEMQEEIRKLNVEIQHQIIELSETQKLNQSLQQSNDDLRNRKGLMSRKEQERLEKEIKDVRGQNSKLQVQVNKSSVEAVDEACKKQREAEKQLHLARCQAEQNRKEAQKEIQKLKKEMKLQSEKIKGIKVFCGIGYIMVIVFAVCIIGIYFL